MHVHITQIDEAKNDLVLSEKEAWKLRSLDGALGPLAFEMLRRPSIAINKIAIDEIGEEISRNNVNGL
ncbi:hypothetical protein D8674_001397 [Pyrus ussuriensis x Pyrus communis]|uniref:Uncharacterized protein n=1 Tax=Pyrus ussuriensis x Pyrus communis TaxID=2448454 RepID=A0A5N5F6A7_9ROSA|nr:hypothetical protein D8674_001397 [Pyrus ussuriensis x Pyrus communis]